MLPIRALATDVDGTLTNRSYGISCAALEALRRLEKEGISVILASGNAYPVLRALRGYVGGSGAIVCENGAVVEYKDEVKLLGDKREAEAALKALKEACGKKVVESWQNPFRLVDVALRRTVDREQIEDALKAFPNMKLIDSGFAYHILRKDIDKAVGLRVACDMMDLKMSELAAVGDSETDREMLLAVALKAAVGDAPESLRRIADYVASKANGEGVAELADYLLREARR